MLAVMGSCASRIWSCLLKDLVALHTSADLLYTVSLCINPVALRFLRNLRSCCCWELPSGCLCSPPANAVTL